MSIQRKHALACESTMRPLAALSYSLGSTSGNTRTYQSCQPIAPSFPFPSAIKASARWKLMTDAALSGELNTENVQGGGTLQTPLVTEYVPGEMQSMQRCRAHVMEPCQETEKRKVGGLCKRHRWGCQTFVSCQMCEEGLQHARRIRTTGRT